MAFPATEEVIAAEETRLATRFPAAFRAYLKAINGGEIEIADDVWQVHSALDTTDRKRAARSASHIARETAAARQWSGFPPAAVAIADNGSGDRLVLVPDDRDPTVLASAVYLWSHETGQLTRVAEEFPG